MDFPSFITKVQPGLLLDSAGVTGKAQEFKNVSQDEVGHFTNLSKDRLMFLYRIVLLSFAKSSSITLLLPNLKRSRAPFQKCARETTHPLLFLLAVYF